MKQLLLSFAVLASLSAFAQEPAGTCIFVDYEAFQVDNVVRYVNCGNNEVLNPGSEVTIQCWTRINDTNWNQKVCGKTNGSFIPVTLWLSIKAMCTGKFGPRV